MARVLVIDDDDDVRDYLVDALTLAGHEVAGAPDGRTGLLVAAREGFHVVVTDLRMPGIDGMEVLRRLRADQPETEVVMLTAHGDVPIAVEAMRAGAFDFLTKPLESPAALRLVVERAAERRRLRDRTPEAPRETDGPRLTWGAPTMVPVVDALRRVATRDATVLLTGSSGAGKEVAARALHAWSERADGPFEAVNCAALSDALLESELFGHEKGAFTGAEKSRRGRLERAEGGTFFLDEVGELAPALQARLLRVLQERTFERVGGERTLHADVRWIAATNRDLKAEVEAGRFRADLYHRLAVFPVRIPDLSERREDITPLAHLLLERIGREQGRPGLGLTGDAERWLGQHHWPGQVRELRNVLERAAILTDGRQLDVPDLSLAAGPLGTPTAPATAEVEAGIPPTLEEAEKTLISRTLALYDGHRERTAQHLGIGVRTLYDKIKRYDL